MPSHVAGDIIEGRYRLDEVLGRGGFAVTWRATDLQSGALVAVKELAIRAVEQWRAVELFEREARVLKNLAHPHIPAYVDFIAPSDADQAFVLVQGLAPGKSLAALVKSGWRATEADARDIARQVLETLVYLHGFSPPVVHRDLKPDNLIRSDDGNIMVVDFGAVRDTLASESEVMSVAGTFGYMAPEQFAGSATPASDLYSLGATLVHVLSHKAPSELPQRELKLDFRPYVQASEGFLRFLEGLLEPTPERRIASARAALDALDRPASMTASRRGAVTQSTRLSFEGERLVLETKNRSNGYLVKLGFSIAWLAFVTFWCAIAIGMDAPIYFPLFSIPFWVVGITMFVGGVRGLLSRTHLELAGDGALIKRRMLVPTSSRVVPLADILAFEGDRLGRIQLMTERTGIAVATLSGKDEAEKVSARLNEHLASLNVR